MHFFFLLTFHSTSKTTPRPERRQHLSKVSWWKRKISHRNIQPRRKTATLHHFHWRGLQTILQFFFLMFLLAYLIFCLHQQTDRWVIQTKRRQRLGIWKPNQSCKFIEFQFLKKVLFFGVADFFCLFLIELGPFFVPFFDLQFNWLAF